MESPRSAAYDLARKLTGKFIAERFVRKSPAIILINHRRVRQRLEHGDKITLKTIHRVMDKLENAR